MTYENSQQTFFDETELELMSSAEVSRARTSARRETVRALKASAAAYGSSMPDSLARYDRASSSWRTSQHCFIEGLSEFSEAWPRSGTMRSGIAYLLPPLVPLTDVTASGLLANPNSDGQSVGSEHDEARWVSSVVANAGKQHEQGEQHKLFDAEKWRRSVKRQIGSCGNGVGWWATEPGMGRVAHGVPNRAHRLRGLGNAVVPQIPEMIGNAILASM